MNSVGRIGAAGRVEEKKGTFWRDGPLAKDRHRRGPRGCQQGLHVCDTRFPKAFRVLCDDLECLRSDHPDSKGNECGAVSVARGSHSGVHGIEHYCLVCYAAPQSTIQGQHDHFCEGDLDRRSVRLSLCWAWRGARITSGHALWYSGCLRRLQEALQRVLFARETSCDGKEVLMSPLGNSCLPWQQTPLALRHYKVPPSVRQLHHSGWNAGSKRCSLAPRVGSGVDKRTAASAPCTLREFLGGLAGRRHRTPLRRRSRDLRSLRA